MGALDGKTALVTGAASGIGAEYARRLASLGATTFVADINEPAGKAVAESIESDGGSAIAIAIDVTDEDSIAGAVRATAEHGGVDVLVNNAALYRGMTIAPVEHLDPAHWRTLLEVNVTGVFLGVAGVHPPAT